MSDQAQLRIKDRYGEAIVLEQENLGLDGDGVSVSFIPADAVVFLDEPAIEKTIEFLQEQLRRLKAAPPAEQFGFAEMQQ